MGKLLEELVICFNEIMLMALKGASKRYKNPLRIGCLLFSDKLIPAWNGFRSLSDLGTNPLNIHMLKQPGLGGKTTLYGAMRSSILWTAAAREIMRENGLKKGRNENPKGKIIILTDGANNNPPHDPAAVKKILTEIESEHAENIQPMIGFFKTTEGLTERQFEEMVRATGFEGMGFYEIASGLTIHEQRREFRHKFEIFSSRCLASNIRQ